MSIARTRTDPRLMDNDYLAELPGLKRRNTKQVNVDYDSETDEESEASALIQPETDLVGGDEDVSDTASDKGQDNDKDNDEDDYDMFGSDTEKPATEELEPSTEVPQKITPDDADSEEAVEVEAFNLQDEVNSGKYDQDMNYVGKKDSDDEQEEDAWILDASKTDVLKAKKAQVAQQQRQQAAESTQSTAEILDQLIPLLDPAESPMEALARLRPPKKGKSDKPHRKETVYTITECCELLVSKKGVSDAYDLSREELMRLYQRETGEVYQARGVKRTALDMEEAGDAKWEFRWIGDPAVHGPYSAYEMQYWKESYFEGNVEVRLQNEETFRPVAEVEFE